MSVVSYPILKECEIQLLAVSNDNQFTDSGYQGISHKSLVLPRYKHEPLGNVTYARRMTGRSDTLPWNIR